MLVLTKICFALSLLTGFPFSGPDTEGVQEATMADSYEVKITLSNSWWDLDEDEKKKVAETVEKEMLNLLEKGTEVFVGWGDVPEPVVQTSDPNKLEDAKYYLETVIHELDL